MKNTSASSYLIRNLFFKLLFSIIFFFFFLTLSAQQYTESFATAPAFIANPGAPSWNQIATVTLGGTPYQFINSGNGGWEYKTTGGLGNSANLLYNATNTSTVTIMRQDGQRFQFYGAWLKYKNDLSYPIPFLRVTYNGSRLPEEIFGSNIIVQPNKDVNVTSITLYFSGLQSLNFDNIIVGPQIPVSAFLNTDDISLFSDNSATLGGSVNDDGGVPVAESGVVYSTSPQPTVADHKIPLSSGVSSFSQVATGFQGGATYYVRSYAINSAGTSYGQEKSFTTFGTFNVVGTHYFNSAWQTSDYQSSPFTKYVEGWDATGESTGAGLISIIKLTGDEAAEGEGSLSIAEDTYGESLTYMSMKPHDGSLFNLQSFLFRYNVQDAGTSFGTITVTGYKNGVAVPGAVQTMQNIAPAIDDPAYHSFTVNGNIFDNIDEFRLTASGSVNGAVLQSFDIDVITALMASVLPVTFTSVKAYQKKPGIQVEWNVAAESDVDHYDIEKSSNGQKFVKAFKMAPKGNNYSVAKYGLYDANVFAGNNYYRIKSVFKSGDFTYSQIVNVAINNGKKSIAVNPNPVTGTSFNLQLINQPKGKYAVQLFSITGQQLYNKTIQHTGGSSTEALYIGNTFSTGSYLLKVTTASDSFTQQLIKN